MPWLAMAGMAQLNPSKTCATKKFTVRKHTVLYRLKTISKTLALALTILAQQVCQAIFAPRLRTGHALFPLDFTVQYNTIFKATPPSGFGFRSNPNLHPSGVAFLFFLSCSPLF